MSSREAPGDPDDLEYFVITFILLIRFDAPHELWIGLALANISLLCKSKQVRDYVRARPSSFSAHHIAYVPSVVSIFALHTSRAYPAHFILCVLIELKTST